MYVYDEANNLAKSIQESKEYLEYKKIKEEVNANPEMKAKVDEFEKKELELKANHTILNHNWGYIIKL